MPRVVIPKSSLPPISGETESYSVRYRIISENQNDSSAWSPIFELPVEIDYSLGTGNVSKGLGLMISIWEQVPDVSQYDVWVSWNLLGTNMRFNSRIASNTINLMVPIYQISQVSLTSNVATVTFSEDHQINVGDNVEIDCSNNTFSGSRIVTATTPNSISYSRNHPDISATPATGTVRPFYFSIRVYVSNYPTDVQHPNFLIFEALGNTAA
jgi:hypothetical protein